MSFLLSITDKPWLVAAVALILVAQYALSLTAFYFLIKSQPKLKVFWVWNFVILFLLIAGPVAAIIIFKKKAANLPPQEGEAPPPQNQEHSNITPNSDN